MWAVISASGFQPATNIGKGGDSFTGCAGTDDFEGMQVVFCCTSDCSLRRAAPTMEERSVIAGLKGD
jgi:hypothetical protein